MFIEIASFDKSCSGGDGNLGGGTIPRIFIPPKIKFVGFRVGGNRTHSHLFGLRRTQSESAAE